ncbi:hypothetical protein U1Q18_042059 [Sarracenia purpurea var. burkii]
MKSSDDHPLSLPMEVSRGDLALGFQQGPKGWWGNRSKRGARRGRFHRILPCSVQGRAAQLRDARLKRFGCPDLDLVAEFTELGLVTELFTTRWTHRSERAAGQPKARATRNSETRFCRSWTSGFLTENPSAANQAHGFALHQGSRQ